MSVSADEARRWERRLVKNDNRSRMIAEVVSLEAWHDPFSPDTKSVALHVAVSFQDGRISDGAVNFMLRLSGAEIVVVTAVTERVRIDPPSVRRDAPLPSATIKETSNLAARADASFGFGVKEAAPTAQISAGLTGSVGHEALVTMERTEPAIVVRHGTTADGSHRWRLTRGEHRPELFGTPWDAAESPLLKLVDVRTSRKEKIPPSTRVLVRCRRDDLIISDITLVGESLLDRIFTKNAERAAEAAIRNYLVGLDLPAGDLTNPFAMLTLADVSALEAEPSE